MDSKKYRKKPVVIEALKYERDKNISSCLDFCTDMIYNQQDNEYDIVTLEGSMRITKGDYIIKGVSGEFYPCKPDIFRKTYEEVTSQQDYQPWITVSNVKPEKSGGYLAYVPEHWTDEGHKEGKVIIAYFRELNYEGRRRVWDDGVYSISGEVTHYLPLPEPPKGE